MGIAITSCQQLARMLRWWNNCPNKQSENENLATRESINLCSVERTQSVNCDRLCLCRQSQRTWIASVHDWNQDWRQAIRGVHELHLINEKGQDRYQEDNCGIRSSHCSLGRQCWTENLSVPVLFATVPASTDILAQLSWDSFRDHEEENDKALLIRQKADQTPGLIHWTSFNSSWQNGQRFTVFDSVPGQSARHIPDTDWDWVTWIRWRWGSGLI